MTQQNDLEEEMEQQEQIDFGTPTRKLIRTDAPNTSIEAGLKIDTTRGEQEIYDLVKAAGTNGITVKEAAVQLGKQPNQISGRFTGLSDKGLIEADRGGSRKRAGCRVMVLKPAQ